jgi:hypothetical protein
MVLQRSRLVRVLVAIALVALAAVGLRLSEDNQDFEVVRGVFGEPVAVNSGTITATAVRMGTELSRDDAVYANTPGLFVAIRVAVAVTGTEPIGSHNAVVLAGPRRYKEFEGSAIIQVSSGFATEQEVVFEVDPAELADLTLELAPGGVLTAYPQHVRIHLGITEDNAEAWRASGRDQVLTPDRPTSRGI